jgi:hypothetical protein
MRMLFLFSCLLFRFVRTIPEANFAFSTCSRLEYIVPAGSRDDLIVNGCEFTGITFSSGDGGAIWASSGLLTVSELPSLAVTASSP